LKRRKARLVAKGCSQRPGIDCGETFAPVARISSVRIAAALAAINDASIYHFDVTTAYLNGKLDEEIFMEVPDHMSDALHRIMYQEPEGSITHTKCAEMIDLLNKGDKVLALRKAIYGLRQAGRRWHEELSKTLKDFGLIQSTNDPCIFSSKKEGDVLLVVIYVDDILVTFKKQQSRRPVQISLIEIRREELGTSKILPRH